MRAGRRESVGGRRRRKRGAGKTRLRRLLAGARAERTTNMYCMVVTLDVSKLSGWLNARASCRGEREKHRKRGERRAGRREGVGAAAAAQAGRWEDPTVEAAGKGTRGAHPKHVAHACDAGRVEAQRLVERRRLLPSRKASTWEEG